MDIEIIGNDAVRYAGDLLHWLRSERIPGLEVSEKEGANVPGTQGVELVPIISAILSSGAVVALAQSIHVWIKAKRPELTLKVSIPRKGTFQINAKNAPDEAALLASFRKLIDG